MESIKKCAGCNVNRVWEHKCHGKNCNCKNPECMCKQGKITLEQLMETVRNELINK